MTSSSLHIHVRDAVPAAKDPARPGPAGANSATATAAVDNVMAADAIQLGRVLAGTRWRKVSDRMHRHGCWHYRLEVVGQP